MSNLDALKPQIINSEILDLIGNKAKCYICCVFPSEPYCCDKCDVSLCSICYAKNKICPKCNSFKLIFFPIALKCFYNNINIKCKNKSCQIISKLDNYLEHEGICMEPESESLIILNKDNDNNDNNNVNFNEESKFDESFDILNSRSVAVSQENISLIQKEEDNLKDFISKNKDQHEVFENILSENEDQVLSLKGINNNNNNENNEEDLNFSLISKKFEESLINNNNNNSIIILEDNINIFEPCEQIDNESLQNYENFNKLTEEKKFTILKNMNTRIQNLEKMCSVLASNPKTTKNLNYKFAFANNPSNNKNLIKKQVFQCFECKCITNESVKCENCDKFFCLKCSSFCKKCNKINCKACSKCEICKKFDNCYDCKSQCNQCIKSKNAFCANCVKQCQICKNDALFCKKCCNFTCNDCNLTACLMCSWNCKVCSKINCSQFENIKCKVCGSKSCIEECSKKCSICSNFNCLKCVFKCDKCQIEVCKRCTVKNKNNEIKCFNCIN